MKNVEGSSPKETHEVQPLLSPSEDAKECDWLRWQIEGHIQKQERASGHSRTYLDIIGDYQIQGAGSSTTDVNLQAKGNLNYFFKKKTDLDCTRVFSEKTQKNCNYSGLLDPLPKGSKSSRVTV